MLWFMAFWLFQGKIPFEVAICCRLFHLGVSIGIGRMRIFL